MTQQQLVPPKEVVLAELDELYRGPAWHGPSVLEALNGVDAKTAAAKPFPNRNSIWELVQHLTHGRHVVLERLTGKQLEYPRPVREPWWPVSPAETTEAGWRSDLELLESYHAKLIDAVKAAPDNVWSLVPEGMDQPVGRQLLNMAAHDAYHAGQLKLLALAVQDEAGRAAASP
jgi:uncharacterized damage-inducible protein DinB